MKSNGNVKPFPKPHDTKWQTREDGKVEAPEGWLSYVCDCGSEDFFISKPNQIWQPSVYCRGCGDAKRNWF